MSAKSYHALTKAPEPGAPPLFVLHGTDGDEGQIFDLAQQVLPKAGVVSPRGDVFEGGTARFFRRTGEGGYDMDDLAFRTEAVVEFIAAHKAQHPSAPVYGFEYSNGANILAFVVIARPDLFDRIGLLHPLIPWEREDTPAPAPAPAPAGKRVLITAGKHDPICP